MKNQPHQEAYIFLQDGEIETQSLTYQQLEDGVKAIAALAMAFTQVPHTIEGTEDI
ncbi:MAG: hypothetical protein RM338_23900 [Nostoc sp. DedQUE12a]|nr:hypothetical protein [Nostoc sp. DedQUE12a]